MTQLRTFPRYRTIDDIQDRNRRAGHHYFSPDTMRWFNSRVSDTIYPVTYGAFLVTSERRDHETPRLYTVRFADLTGRISTMGEFQQYRSLSGAHAAARRLATQYADTNPCATAEES